MFRLIKKISYLFTFLFIFFFFSKNINAATFWRCGDFFGFSQDYSTTHINQYISTSVKCMKNSKGSTVYAYCSSRGAHYNNGPYTKDKEWKKENTCTYFFKKKRKKRDSDGNVVKRNGKTVYEYYYKRQKNGDCSVILGYILHTAFNYGTYSSKTYNYADALYSNWTYLKLYTPGKYHLLNSGPSGGWKKNAKLKTIFYKAWASYKKNFVDAKDATTTTDDNEDTSMYSVRTDTGKVTFDYIPANSCGQGSYKSNLITIKNTSSYNIDISVHIPSNVNLYRQITPTNVQSLITNSNRQVNHGEWTQEGLAPGSSIYLYLTADSYVSNVGKILFSGSYTTVKTLKNGGNFTYYDTTRFNPGDNVSQPLIYYEKFEGNKPKEVTVNNYLDKSLDIEFKRITSKGCPTSGGTREGNIYYYGKHNFTGSSKMGCANDYPKNSEKYVTPDFSGCTCTKVNLDNGFVRIIVKEKSSFVFGTFAPNYVYPGGGFALSDSTNGTATSYVTSVLWDFADYSGSTPQFYNSNTHKMESANSKVTEINNKFKSQYLNNKNISLKFKTEDSNESTVDNKKEISDYSISKDLSFTAKGTKGFYAEIKSFELNNAYAASDGRIAYNETSEFKINAGKKYYVPLKYVDSLVKKKISYIDSEVVFPFNIESATGGINLSSTGLFNFLYSANCSEPVIYGLEDDSCEPDCDPLPLTFDLSYRTVNVNEPFPTTVPINWSKFWNGPNSTQNRLRMSQTFNDINNPLYSIDITNEKFKEIIDYNNTTGNYYTTWKVNPNGSDDFVTSKFNKTATDSSYCKSGVYSEDCDKK